MTPTRPPTPQAVAEWLACPLTGFRESPLEPGGGTYSNLLFGHRPEVGRRNAVLRRCFVGRSDPQQRRLGKRPAEEHDPHRKFCRNGPNQAHTAGSRGIADSVEHVSRETRRDGQCWKAVLADQAPDRTGACRRASRHRLDRCTQDVSRNVPRWRDQGVEVILRHALQNDFLISEPVLKEPRHVERQEAVQLLELRLSIHEPGLWANIPVEFRFIDQIPDRLDIRIAALPQVTGEHIFGQSRIATTVDIADRGTGRD